MRTIFSSAVVAVGLLLVAGCEWGTTDDGGTTLVDDGNFQEVVLNSDKPVMVDFYADWCGPCKELAPTIAEVAADFQGKAVVAKLDVDAAPKTASKYGVMSIPTVIIFKNGEEIERIVGVESRERLTEALNDAMTATVDDGSGDGGSAVSGRADDPPHVSDADFEAKVLKSEQPVMVDFYAEWCGPCKLLAPTIKDLAREYAGKASVVKLDVDASPETAAAYGVSSIPTVIVFKGGEEVKRFVGLEERGPLAEALESAIK